MTSYDNDGELVTTLNSGMQISSSYSTTDLATSLGTLTLDKIEKVKVGSQDESTGDWEHLPTTIAYKDTSGYFVEPTATLSNVSTVAFTGETTHLSVFNPIAPADGINPGTQARSLLQRKATIASRLPGLRRLPMPIVLLSQIFSVTKSIVQRALVVPIPNSIVLISLAQVSMIILRLPTGLLTITR